MTAITNRYDFVLLFDVCNGNPNGDPDAFNMPRMDPETGRGLVTDVAIKRRIRNYVALARGDTPGNDIYFQDGSVLNRAHQRAYKAVGIEPDTKNKRLPKAATDAQAITNWMCANYYDVRTFGAVMGTEVNAGQVRGPVQLTFAESIEPIQRIPISIIRSSVTNDRDEVKRQTMGVKYIVPYGLYRAHGFISPRLANDDKKGTGFSDADLSLVWEALANMYDHDRSSSKGEMTTRALIVYKHDSDLGNAPSHKMLERVTVARVTDGPARCFSDYRVALNGANMPRGVTVERRI